MSDSEKKAKADTSPPAPPSPQASGDAKETTKNATAPSPSSTPSPPPKDDSKSNKQPPPTPEKKTPDASPPPSPPEKKTPPPPSTPSKPSTSTDSTPSTSQPPPTPQTSKQSPPAPAQTRSPAQQQSPPAPNSNSKESSRSSSSSSSSSSSESPSDDSPSPPSPSGSSKNSTKTSNARQPPSTGTSQPSSSSNSTSSSPSPVSSPISVNISNTQSSPNSSPQALVSPNGTPSTSNSPNSNSQDESSGSGDSNNDTSSSNNNTNTDKKHNISSNAKHLSTEGLIAVAVVGVLVVAFIILFLYMRQKKNQQSSKSNANYKTPPSANFTAVTSDAQVEKSPGGHDTVYYNSQIHGQQTNIAYSPQGGQNYQGLDSGIMTGSKTFFTYEELMEMTGGFARQNVIGEGGFGCVYKGWMSDGKLVAVKQLKAGSGQGEREFRAEVEIISRVHHKHLVSLVGYSMAENQRLLIYEFVPNNTLEHHLHAKDLPELEWAKRVKIALGAAKGLAYLHEDCHPKIIHRDIKSANILLEDNFEAKASCGFRTCQTERHYSVPCFDSWGHLGSYLAPEYASSGKLTDRSDVYSFGVVLLELLTGRKPIDPTRPLGDESLVEWARPLLIRSLETGDYGEIIDPRLEKRYVESEMIRMVEAAAACVRHSATKRPRMALVVRALDFEGDPDLSNGVKYGDSIAYDSAKYSEEISKFRQMAFGSTDNSSEYDMYSREYDSEMQSGLQNSWESQYSLVGDYTSDELETRALKPDSGEYRGASGRYKNTDSFR